LNHTISGKLKLMTPEDFIQSVMVKAQKHGFKVEQNRFNQRQIDFGHKKLHEGRLLDLYPRIMDDKADIGKLIESVAPGRPCTHRPMKKIIAEIRKDWPADQEDAKG